MQDEEGSSLDLLLISLQINSDKNLMTQKSLETLSVLKKKMTLNIGHKVKK